MTFEEETFNWCRIGSRCEQVPVPANPNSSNRRPAKDGRHILSSLVQSTFSAEQAKTTGDHQSAGNTNNSDKNSAINRLTQQVSANSYLLAASGCVSLSSGRMRGQSVNRSGPLMKLSSSCQNSTKSSQSQMSAKTASSQASRAHHQSYFYYNLNRHLEQQRNMSATGSSSSSAAGATRPEAGTAKGAGLGAGRKSSRSQDVKVKPAPSKLWLMVAISSALILLACAPAQADSLGVEQSELPAQHQQQAEQLAAAASSNYETQQTGGAGPSKGKKIQIVYIKVPLAKLKPSLESQYAGDNSTSGHTKGSQYDSNESKLDGSQSADQQQQLSQAVSANALGQTEQQAARQPASLLIPMAVVQAGSGHEQRGFGAGSASNQETQHAQPPSSRSQRSRPHLSPMQLHQSRQQPFSVSVHHGINHGFMSSFLSGEKEKMAAAVAKLQQSASTSAPASANSQASPQTQPPTQSQAVHQMDNNPKGPGGLMPVMMVPYSHMPDNMIGQAYNAAVGRALPIESGSPTAMLGSPSTDQGTKGGYAKQPGPTSGGNAGTGSDSASSHGTTQAGSYGSSGPSQPGAGSSGSGYQGSGSGYAGSEASSGYGNGINSFGASVAFSDYPTASGPQQQTYGAQQPANNNNNNRPYSQSAEHGSAQGPAEAYANQKLRQAKKTIIPIVVQVEHAILENNGANLAANYNQQQQQQQMGARPNKYGSNRGHRQLGGKRARGNKSYRQQQQQGGAPYGAASNEVSFQGGDSHYLNAANAHDINQITAAINAENAANAAAALAQADMAFGQGSPAYVGGQSGRHQQANMNRPMQQYANGLQSAASALLANTHPVLQAAASGGLASVSKLGAKLGEIIALPSMQVPQAISSIGASLPSAFSSITNQMGAQLNQAVQQVAKEHPTAHAFARQVAQQAGLQLPHLANQQQQQQQQMSAAASNQHIQQQPAPLSAQAQLQNLKFSIGHNLQNAAASFMGVQPKANAQSAAQMLASPLAVLYPASVNAALKQLTAGGAQGNQFNQNLNQAQDPHHAQSSQLVPTSVQQPSFGPSNQPDQFGAMQAQQGQQGQVQSGDSHSQAFLAASGDGSPTKQTGKAPSSIKSKFLSFFQPPKFISNLLSWNDRADERNDMASLDETGSNSTSPIESANSTTTSTTVTSKAPELPKTTLSAVTSVSTNSTTSSG